MTQISRNYARVLYDLSISKESIEAMKELCKSKELMDALDSPIVAKDAKHNIVAKVFPKEVHNFMKLLCDYGSSSYLEEIMIAYEEYINSINSCLEAELICVEAPSAEQQKKIEQFLMGEYGKNEIKLNITKDNSLIGGFVLKALDKEYDWSLKGRMSQLTEHLSNL